MISNSRNDHRRSSSASSRSDNSNSRLPTSIVMSSNSSLGGSISNTKRSQNFRNSRKDVQAGTDRVINAAIARTIATDLQVHATQLVDNPRIFKSFQARLTKTPVITNLAARQVLRDDVMRSKAFYVSQKRELVSQHEAEAAQMATQSVAGVLSSALSSAFSLDPLAGLEMECSTSHFGNIDLAEQHAIMSEIIANRRKSKQQAQAGFVAAATSRRSSSVTSMSQASDLSTAVPTAAQVLANSLGDQFKRISMSLSSVAKPSSYDDSLNMCASYNRSLSIPSTITSSTAPSSAYTGHSSYKRCSSLSNASRRSSVESIDSTNNMSASTLNTGPTPKRDGSWRLSELRMSFLAFNDVFEDDLDEVSNEDRSTSSSDHDVDTNDNNDATVGGSANTSSMSFNHAQYEMDKFVRQDQVLAAKLQSAEIQEELLCAWPHQMRAAHRRASMASDASSIDDRNVKKSAYDELNAQTAEMRRQFYRRMSNQPFHRVGSDRKLSANSKEKDGDGQDFNESFSTIKKARAA